MAQYRLLIDYVDEGGAFHKRGTLIERPDGWKGPMMCINKKHTADIADNKNVPAFELVKGG